MNLVKLDSSNASFRDLVVPADQENFERCQATCEKVQVSMKSWAILVNVSTQMLHLFKEKERVHSYFISTSEKGVGQEADTGKTPLGLHQVQEKIGDGADPYAIFESRVNTGKLASSADQKGYVLTRILRLKGLEEGYNAGKNEQGVVVDSFDRYIYIHGTNRIDDIGKPTSAGCVRMKPDEMIHVFDLVPEGALVYIYTNSQK